MLPRGCEYKYCPQDWAQRGQGGEEGVREPAGVATEIPSELCSSSKASVNLFYFCIMSFPHREIMLTVKIMNAY